MGKQHTLSEEGLIRSAHTATGKVTMSACGGTSKNRQAPAAQRSKEPPADTRTSAPFVEARPTLPEAAVEWNQPRPDDPRKIITPLLADRWEELLRLHGIYNEFHDIPDSIRHGFDLGAHDHISQTYIPPNHSSADQNMLAIDAYINDELTLGRYSGPFTPKDLERRIGPFRSSPLGAVPKGEGVRLIQDLSFGTEEHPSVNSGINSDDFPCQWGTFSQMVLQVLGAPPGTQGASLDVDSAFRNCPVRTDQQQHFIVFWRGQCYIDHCVAFGGASSCGVFGRLADAFVRICQKRDFGPCIKWVDDFVFIRHPAEQDLPQRFTYEIGDIIRLGDYLGLPWKAKKTHPFASSVTYLGMLWSFAERSVQLPLEKKEKYLQRLAEWEPGKRVGRREVDKVLGTLVHCALAVPDGRSHLVAITRLASSIGSANSRFSRWLPSATVLADIGYWRLQLSRPFCGSILHAPPAISQVEFWVDASTSWGVGVVFDGAWQSWRFKPGWRAEGHDIGWAEMLAIELGLRTAVAYGFRDTHFRVKSDNTGVIGSLAKGKAYNLAHNRVLQRIVALMRMNGLWITSEYVASADNIADSPSRGLPATGFCRAQKLVALPPCIAHYLELAPCL
jgi:hypothetical protein